MSGDFWVFLVAFAAGTWGTHASGKQKPPAWSFVVMALLWTYCGIHAILCAWLTGDGNIVPGLQLSPGLRSLYAAQVMTDESAVSFDPAWGLVALGAHALLLVFVRTKAAWLCPLPATIAFVALFFVIDARADLPPIAYSLARGPSQDAYVTVVPLDDGGSRILIAAGDPTATFLDVVHAHTTESAAPSLKLDWTRDGKVLVLRSTHEHKPAFAVDLDGKTTGALPVKAHEWAKAPGAYVPPAVARRFSHARLEVGKLIQAHGDIYAAVR